MNAKMAKMLRKFAREAASQPNGYVSTTHKERLISTSELTPTGERKLVVYAPVTLTNNSESPRGKYRALKKAWS